MLDKPRIPVGTHPIEQKQYILPTLEILRLMDVVKQIITNGLPGMIVYGRPRLGKTFSTLFAVNYLPVDLGMPIPIFLAECKQYKAPNEEKFYRDLLIDFKFNYTAKKDPVQLRQQIVNLFQEKAERTPLRRVVLVMDEAQRMTEWQYNCLSDIYNQLVRERISMTVISVGQDELLDRRSFFLINKKAHIIGRFMPREHQFHGIRSEKELTFCLKNYDVSEYPDESGWSYTRYFFPDAFAAGRRLGDFGKDLYDLFIEVRKEFGLKGKLEIPMEYLAFTVEIALKTFGTHGKCNEWITIGQWREAIKNSGYIESEIFMALA